jgi:hypothetical protein
VGESPRHPATVRGFTRCEWLKHPWRCPMERRGEAPLSGRHIAPPSVPGTRRRSRSCEEIGRVSHRYRRHEEATALRSQSATSKGRGGRRYAPYVFTEQGVAMLSGVRRSLERESKERLGKHDSSSPASRSATTADLATTAPKAPGRLRIAGGQGLGRSRFSRKAVRFA